MAEEVAAFILSHASRPLGLSVLLLCQRASEMGRTLRGPPPLMGWLLRVGLGAGLPPSTRSPRMHYCHSSTPYHQLAGSLPTPVTGRPFPGASTPRQQCQHSRRVGQRSRPQWDGKRNLAKVVVPLCRLPRRGQRAAGRAAGRVKSGRGQPGSRAGAGEGRARKILLMVGACLRYSMKYTPGAPPFMRLP